MPPYAGLDEIYHVARTVFVMSEGRNPTDVETSVPLFVHESLNEAPRALPDISDLREKWPAFVAAPYQLPQQLPLTLRQKETYTGPNYEAQQPSLYYWTAAVTASVLAEPTALTQLRFWRFLSALFAFITVVATALIGYRLLGIYGMLPALLLPHLPTWQTLVTRASNDALACALLALAILASLRAEKQRGDSRSDLHRRPIPGYLAVATEAVTWALALSVKLYTWPAAIILPILWRYQHASRVRVATVLLLCAVAVSVTMLDVRSRTGNTLGLFAFDRPQNQTVSPVPIDYFGIVKITISSGIWMSGQHNNALTVPGMALYILPLILITGYVLLKHRRRLEPALRPWLLASVAAMIAFLLAQGVNMAGYIRQAKAAGLPLPGGGKEGWYWYVLAPLLLTVIGGIFFRVSPRILSAFVVLWIVAFDITITEGALFRDYGGLTSPATPAHLFRWGPAPQWSSETFRALLRVAAGPFTSWLVWLRVADVIVVLAALSLFETSKDERRDQNEKVLSPRW